MEAEAGEVGEPEAAAVGEPEVEAEAGEVVEPDAAGAATVGELEVEAEAGEVGEPEVEAEAGEPEVEAEAGVGEPEAAEAEAEVVGEAEAPAVAELGWSACWAVASGGSWRQPVAASRLASKQARPSTPIDGYDHGWRTALTAACISPKLGGGSRVRGLCSAPGWIWRAEVEVSWPRGTR
jgi:hypothetical protein